MGRYTRIRFVIVALILNASVAVMFRVVTLPPPVMAIHAIPIPVTRPVRYGTPVHLWVPSLGLSLRVSTGTYDAATASWTVGNGKAYYADQTVPANDTSGTTLIYGHARANVFANLPSIKPGATAIVATDTGYTFTYTYSSMGEVAPSDTSVLTNDGSPTLVLQTCIGDWSAYRGLFSFTLSGVAKT